MPPRRAACAPLASRLDAVVLEHQHRHRDGARARLERDVRALDTAEPVEEAPDAKPAETR